MGWTFLGRLAGVMSLASVVAIAAAGCEDGGAGGAAGSGGGDGLGGSGGSGGVIDPVDCDAIIDFEDECGPFALIGFGGAEAAIIDNPDASGINTTAKVVRSEKFAGEDFGGVRLDLDAPVDFSRGTAFTMKVWAPRIADVLFKLEEPGDGEPGRELGAIHTGSASWESVCVDFAGLTSGFEAIGITVIFDLGEIGDAEGDPDNWTFFHDGIAQTDACPESDVEYELVFSDEFNSGDAPDPSTWNIETGYGPEDPGWGNNEWQLYTDLPENVRVEGGNLVIQARCSEENAADCGVRDGTITSARINTKDKFEFKYGKIEARIQPPVGEAAWPAFWSLGAVFPDTPWPRAGEIDFMEMHNAFSNDRTTHFTAHWCDETLQAPEECSFPAGHVFFPQNRTFDSSLGDDFHLFQAEWDETKIVGKIDGFVYFTKAIKPDVMDELQKDFFLLLNVAMGGTLGSDNQPPSGAETYPQTMLVDYVRVYQPVD